MPDTALPATTAPPHDPVRAALDDPAVYERLLAQARAVVRRPGVDHEDLVQTAIKRAIANAHKFNPELGSVTVWLAGFVRNVAREQLRTTVKGATADDALDRLPAPPTDEAELADLWASVRRHLADLPERHRRAVELRHLDGMGYADMAAELNVSEETARQRVSRGIQTLRTLATKEASS